ncbi:anoctamin-4-like isoform X2 [Oscarella lobularis]|uniref:anoctamin-4-like isoform X2 n=1 Tax=Oscarella lobularis TaxID=121494 RepID=UPI0033142E41
MTDTAIGFEGVAMEVKTGDALPGYVDTPAAGGYDYPETDGGGYADKGDGVVEETAKDYDSTGASGGSRQTLFFEDGKRRIDFVLVYQEYEDKPEEWREKRRQKRHKFIERLVKEGLKWEEDKQSFDGKSIFIKLHAPWTVLVREAEQLGLKMPVEENNYVTHSWWERTKEKLNCCSLKSPFNHGMGEIQRHITLTFNKGSESKFRGVEDRENFFSPAQRSLIVHDILLRTPYSDDQPKVGYERLIENKTFEAAYPLHSGRAVLNEEENDQENDRSRLRASWGRWGAMFKTQPLDHIRAYFGEKVGIYFCWLGFYTQWLIPVTIIGLIAFLIGLSNLNSPPADQYCNETSFFMCPPCDTSCDFYYLNETCYYAKAASLFDNTFTVIFTVIMCLWSIFFLEFWKRREVSLAVRWDVYGFEDLEERPRAAFEARAKEKKVNPVTDKLEGHVSQTTKCGKLVNTMLLVLLLICLVVGIVLAVIIYRLSIVAVFNRTKSIRPYSSIFGTITAATIQLIAIAFMNFVYQRIAEKLTHWENHRTQTEFDDHFTFKMFLFQCVNYYSSVFYIAFFKGKFAGYPGHYNQPFGARLDECGSGGCMIELTQQLGIIMVGKQILNNFMEIVLPWLKGWWRRRDSKDDDLTDNKTISRWEEDLDLADLSPYGLFAEYLEMVIQYGFITIFVAAFPLAPLFALLNNILEIRLDGKKFVTFLRRPVAQRAQDIGIWYSILEGIAKFSVITNAFIIALTSEFLPRILYYYEIGNKTLDNYVDYSLAKANVSSLNNPPNPSDYFKNGSETEYTHEFCRYFGYRQENGDYTLFYYRYLTIALAFVIVFEHVIFGLVAFISWIIPDIPGDLQNQMKREQYLGKIALREREVEQIDSGTVTSKI